jgi:hypothetical protein
MQKIAVFLVMGGLVLLLSGITAGETTGLDSLRISGCGAMEMGQVVHGWYGNWELAHKWQEHFWGKLVASAKTNERTDLEFGFEFHYQYSVTSAFTYIPSFFPMVSVILDRAYVNYKVLEGAYPVSVQAGYFPFKYNPEVRNIGEYLFRSGCYPTFVTNIFDWSVCRLLGFNVENSLFKGNEMFSVDQNLIISTETEMYPYGDVSISYLFSLDIMKRAFNLGGGISAFRILPVDEKATTPHKDGADGTIAEVKNVRPGTDQYGNLITVGDTTFFSFAGTKLMVRGSIDPKAFFQSDIFGKEDLKIYGELAVLGLKSYPVYVDSLHFIGTNPDITVRYDILKERMPFMVGFNIPTFKFFDVVSFEWEYWANRYLNNRFNQLLGTTGTRYPLPTQPALPANRLDSNSVGKVKWSIYAKKQFKNVSVVTQFGRDHRQVFALSDPRMADYGDNLIKSKDWYYLVKVQYGF